MVSSFFFFLWVLCGGVSSEFHFSKGIRRISNRVLSFFLLFFSHYGYSISESGGRDVFISVASFLQVMCAHLRDGKCMEEGTISYIAYYLYLCIAHTIPVRSTWST